MSELASYTVTWTIDLDAASAEDAAVRALRIQRNPDSIATVFQVQKASGAVYEVDVDQAVSRACQRNDCGDCDSADLAGCCECRCHYADPSAGSA